MVVLKVSCCGITCAAEPAARAPGHARRASSWPSSYLSRPRTPEITPES